MSKFNDPFNPEDGAFAQNIRSITGDDSELRASLKKFGWHLQFPALVDENKVVLVGHRRMKIAEELGIEPVFKTVTLGKGDEADAERLKLAIISNIGQKPLTAADRKRIAAHLYKGEWTMQRIANALNVTQKTISKDLDDYTQGINQPRPKGGRPKGSKSARGKTPKLDQAREIVREKVEAEQRINPRKLQEEHGISHVTFETAVAVETARKEAIEEKTALDPSLLSKSAQEKLEAAMRQHQRKLDQTFEARVRDGIKRRIDEIILPHWKKQIEEAKQLYARRRGLMDKATFNKIRRALHPDSRQAASDKVLAEAFDTFMSLEKYLLNEKDSPTDFGKLPESMAEWDAMKARANAERRNRRNNSNLARR